MERICFSERPGYFLSVFIHEVQETHAMFAQEAYCDTSIFDLKRFLCKSGLITGFKVYYSICILAYRHREYRVMIPVMSMASRRLDHFSFRSSPLQCSRSATVPGWRGRL